MRLLLVSLVVLLAMQSARADTVIYVRNVKVPPPCQYAGGEVYVPRETLLRLFGDAIRDIGAGTLNGKPAAVQTVQHAGQTWFPVIGVARLLGWEVLPQPAIGIVDVASPRNVRLGRLPAELPADPVEKERAERADRLVLREYEGACDDAHMIARVERIGYKIALACGRPNVHWRFTVLNSLKVQALSVGMGHIYVTHGLLALLDDQELAGAIAHEVAHDVMRHSTRATDAADLGEYYLRQAEAARARQKSILAESPSVLQKARYQEAVQQEQEFLQKAQGIVDRLQHWSVDSRDQEREADRMGMIYAHDAGFNPLGLVFCLEKLMAQSPDAEPLPSGLEAVSTHPPLPERLALARKVYDSYFRK